MLSYFKSGLPYAILKKKVFCIGLVNELFVISASSVIATPV